MKRPFLQNLISSGILIIVLCCFSIPGITQPKGIFITDQGKVGIGTLTPFSLLEARSGQPNEAPTFTLGNSGLTHYLQMFGGHDGNPNPYILWRGGDPFRFITSSEVQYERARFTPTGNFGIGTDNPLGKMHVYGTGVFAADQDGILIAPGTSHSALAFKTQSGAFYNIYLKWAQTYFNGNVGIGTNNPQELLHVNDRIRIGHDPNYGSVFGELIHEGGGTGFKLNAGANGSWADIHFQTNGTTKMFLESAGKLGIGTISPITKLHIEGGADATLSSGGFFLMGDALSQNLVMDNNELMSRSNGAASTMYINHQGGNVNFLAGSTTGSVNIGTTAGASGYRLSVNGRIMGEELRIENDGDWPDYVFHANYALLPLKKLEHFIQVEGHLPGIPSAGTIQEEGIMVGDMQKRMMTKIEELTLYILQLQKENEALKNRVEKLESSNY